MSDLGTHPRRLRGEGPRGQRPLLRDLRQHAGDPPARRRRTRRRGGLGERHDPALRHRADPGGGTQRHPARPFGHLGVACRHLGRGDPAGRTGEGPGPAALRPDRFAAARRLLVPRRRPPTATRWSSPTARLSPSRSRRRRPPPGGLAFRVRSSPWPRLSAAANPARCCSSFPPPRRSTSRRRRPKSLPAREA